MYNYNYNAYGMNNNPYNPYSIQQMEQIRDGWDAKIQMAQQQSQNQQPQTVPNQPTNLTQNFQLAPQTNNNSELESRYAENIDEVKNTFVMKTGVFVTKDLSTMWIKDVSGNIRTFRTEEIKELDDKDIQIQSLKKELENMKYLMTQTVQASEKIEDVAPTKSTRTNKK